MTNKIIFTGGGTAGHVVPNLALIEKFREQNWEIFYIGSKNGIEKELIAQAKIEYHSIATGKLRRYFSWQNFLAPFQTIQGIIQALLLCRQIKPNIIFSKGGFVSFPVVLAGWLNRTPVMIHESDLTPGLANRLSFPFADKICVSLDETKKYISGNKEKIAVTGTPIRNELFHGDAQVGREKCKFNNDKKIILVQGGGLGSESINKMLRELLPKLLPNFQIVHSCGKNKIDNSLIQPGYCQFEFINKELPDIFACADLVISRAGANSIFELIALKKPHILLPLSLKASRGDQLMNAKYWSDLGLSRIINPKELNAEKLYNEMVWLSDHLDEYHTRLAEYKIPNSVDMIFQLTKDIANDCQKTKRMAE